MNRKVCRIIAFAGMVLVMLTGCRGNADAVNRQDRTKDRQDKGIMVSNNALSDEGRILINAAGYEKNGSKKALIRDMDEAAGFEVINVDTDEAVFEGRVKYRKEVSESSKAVGVCDFSDVDKKGSYYIRVNNGRVSDVFKIEENIYRKFLSDKLSSLGGSDMPAGLTEENMGAQYLRITDYLLAQEFFPDSINPAVNGDARIIPRTMLIAKAETDLLKELIRDDGSICTPLSDDVGRQYQYSAVFALFAYEYREYDEAYAGECADIAKKVFSYAQDGYSDSSISDKKKADDKRFWASAQLYKLTGMASYREITESYAEDTPIGWNIDECGYLGSLAYLTCYYRTDLDISGQFITKLMDDINTTVRESFKYDYLVAEDGFNDVIDKDKERTDDKDTEDDFISETAADRIFEKARLAVLGNYISKNIRYVECGENYLAFLYGRNMLGKDYAYAQDSEFFDEPQMFILAGLIDSYIYEDKQPEAMER